ncbi:substrate binding domain-containing protein [Ensifer adhaerens]|uniref:substrate binding domain-containing protein n=1 Tax=Ensifer adhaerens TaxID=106592 RepID=UPI002E12D998
MAGAAKTRVRGKLRVNVDGTFGHFVLAPRINDFLERYPELSVEIFVRDAIGDFVGEGTDVAVRFGEPGAHSMQTELLLETRVFTCVSAKYLERNGEPKTPADLSNGHQCVLIRDPVTGRAFTWEFQRRGETVPFAATGRVTVNDTGSLLGACRSGAGIAQLLELYVRDELADGDLIQILPDWSEETFPLHAYYRRSDLMPAKLRAFLDFVREIVA